MKMNYVDDKYLTNLLLTEMANHQTLEDELSVEEDIILSKKHPIPSDELTQHFIDILHNILKKPNFSGYYEEVRDNMISKSQIIFLSNWYKFKPYRVRNNFRLKYTMPRRMSDEEKLEYNKRLQIITRVAYNKERVIYVNEKIEPFYLLQIDNRTYTVKDVKQINADEYQVEFFNKLKCDIDQTHEVNILVPKTDFLNPDLTQLGGAFTYLSLFAFTGIKEAIKDYKRNKENIQDYLSSKEADYLISGNNYEIDEM